MLSHISPRDKRIKYEAEEKAKIYGFPTAKELRQAREAAEAHLKREEDEAEKVGTVGHHSCTMYGGNDELIWSNVSQKRKSQVSSRPSKAGESSMPAIRKYSHFSSELRFRTIMSLM